MTVVQAVPGGVDPGVGQPEIGRKIDHGQSGPQQLGGVVHGRAVGDGQKDQLAGCGQIGGVGHDDLHVAGLKSLEKRVDGLERPTGLGPGGGPRQFQDGVHGEDSGQLHAGVAGHPDQSDGNRFHSLGAPDVTVF